MTELAAGIHYAIDPDQQALRAADAAWESARWAAWTVGISAGMLLLTAGLLLGAFLAAKYARKTWESTRDELHNSNEELGIVRQDNLQREAVNVSAWLSMSKETLHVFVRNGNGGPIYDVNCYVWAKSDETESIPTVQIHHWHRLAVAPAIAEIGMDQRLELGPDPHVFGYADADGERHTKNGSTAVKLESLDEWKIWNGEPSESGLAIKLTFRDSKGNYWLRDWDGSLLDEPAAKSVGLW